MRAAGWLPERRDDARLLVVDPASGAFREGTVGEDLPSLLRRGDLLVVNDAATLPASLMGSDGEGRPVEVRLVSAAQDETFWAALLGAGNWRQRTEDRPHPPPLEPGATLVFGARRDPAPAGPIHSLAAPPSPLETSTALELGARRDGEAAGRLAAPDDAAALPATSGLTLSGATSGRPAQQTAGVPAPELLHARVVEVSSLSPRLVRLAFDARGADLWAAIYRHGRPVQYAHASADLPLWAVQTVYAARPWAVEMPSAGRPLSWQVLLGLRARGVAWASLTHAAGLSATGDPAIDHALPLPERFDIPPATVAAVRRARAAGGRILAVGTTVVRALEGAVAHGRPLRPGPGETDLRLGPAHRPRLVDGILSGMHAPGESHFELLRAFADGALLTAAWQYAATRGFRSHELGDAMVVLPGTTAFTSTGPGEVPSSRFVNNSNGA